MFGWPGSEDFQNRNMFFIGFCQRVGALDAASQQEQMSRQSLSVGPGRGACVSQLPVR